MNEPEGSLKPKANEKKQWAILDNSDVKDFHRQVPDMAFKVGIICFNPLFFCPII